MKKVFKNTAFKQRDYKTTNVVYAVGDVAPQGDNWVETDEFADELLDAEQLIKLLTDTRHLYTQNGVRYYGYL